MSANGINRGKPRPQLAPRVLKNQIIIKTGRRPIASVRENPTSQKNPSGEASAEGLVNMSARFDKKQPCASYMAIASVREYGTL